MQSRLKSEPDLRIKPFSDVYVSTGNGKLNKVLMRGFDALGGITKVVKPGQSVLLKPNLTAGFEPITGSTTPVNMCEAVVKLIQEHCAPGTIYLGENTLSGNATQEIYKKQGFVEMCERLGVELVDFTYAERVDVEIASPMYAEVIAMPKLVMDVDVFITLPILKNHDTVCVTAAIKNSFGLVENDTRRRAHRDNAVEQYLVDITKARKPDFAIVDGRIGMEGIAGGSHIDYPRYANRIVMGADPVAVDIVCTHVMVQNPRVRYLQWADEEGLGNCNMDYINLHGMTMEEAKVPFMTPAGEIEDQTDGKIRLTDLGSCSRCRAVAQGTLHRFNENNLTKDVDIVYGPGEWKEDDRRGGPCLLIGNCIREEYRACGTWIPGCPMNRDDYMNALSTMDIICSKCATAAERFVASRDPEEMRFVRILASNRTVFQGADNKAGPTDFMLTIGECQQGYARFHIYRSAEEIRELGLGDIVKPEFFAVHIPGHNPTHEVIEEALNELKDRAEKWKAMRPA